MTALEAFVPWCHRGAIYLESFGAICYLELSEAIWSYLELSGAIWRHEVFPAAAQAWPALPAGIECSALEAQIAVAVEAKHGAPLSGTLGTYRPDPLSPFAALRGLWQTPNSSVPPLGLTPSSAHGTHFTRRLTPHPWFSHLTKLALVIASVAHSAACIQNHVFLICILWSCSP